MFTAIVLETMYQYFVTSELSRLVPILSQVQRSILLPNFVTQGSVCVFVCTHTKERERTNNKTLFVAFAFKCSYLELRSRQCLYGIHPIL